MDLEQHIKDVHGGSKREFAKSINKTRTQVYRYIKMGCFWYDGDVCQRKTNLNKPVQITCPTCGHKYLGWPHQEGGICFECYTDKDCKDED